MKRKALLVVAVLTYLSLTVVVFSSLDRSSIIRMTEDWPTYIDPAVGSSFSDCIAIVNLYDSLVFPNPDGSVRPHLAESWDVSEDNLVYTFHLKRGVKFHSGNELTADDVAFSMNRLLTIGEGFAYLFTPVMDEAVSVDRYTVEFRLKKPFGPFVPALVRLYILEKELVLSNLRKPGPYGEFGDFGRDWLLVNDAGSGPYMVEEVKMEEHVIGRKFDEWWGGWEDNSPDYFKLMGTVEPITVRTLMAKKELEITDELQPLENYNAMAKMPGVEVVTYLNGHNLNIMLHTKKAPTDDIHFRRALAYAVDYDTICEIIYPGSIQSKGPVPMNLPGHDSSVEQFEFNLERAKEELKKSKYYNDLKSYPVTLSWCAEAPEEEKIALLVQANCAQLGIEIQITKKPFGSMIADAQDIDTTPNAAIIFVSPHYAEAGGMLMTRYHSSSCGTWEQGEWLQNDEIDSLIEQAIATVNIDDRFEKYSEIQHKIVELCPTIWLFDQAERRAYQASYVYWPTAESAKAGEINSTVMGYHQYVHDMKVYPDRR